MKIIQVERPAECQNCDWSGVEGDCGYILDVEKRVEAGEIMPAGECPECGALCHLVPEGQATRHQIAAARELYQTDDVQIDDRAKVREADSGYWVTARVWVQL